MCVCVCVVVIAVAQEQLRTCVMNDQRPDVNAVTGPETTANLIKDCIKRCWDQSPDRRPSFTGRYVIVFFAAPLTYIFKSVVLWVPILCRKDRPCVAESATTCNESETVEYCLCLHFVGSYAHLQCQSHKIRVAAWTNVIYITKIL